jgi:Tol biopolymer transport system component
MNAPGKARPSAAQRRVKGRAAQDAQQRARHRKARHTIRLMTHKSSRTHAKRRPGFWFGLILGAVLALQACTGPSDSSHFRPISGTGAGPTALAINTQSHFQGHIAFVRNGQLYTIRGKDGIVSNVPTGTDVQDPAYSPDGSRLAYVRRGADWSDLMVINPKGGQPVALTNNQGKGQQITCPNGVSEADATWATNPIWSADGSTLYYLSDAQKLQKTSCGFLDMAIWKIGAQGEKPEFVLWPARDEDKTGLPGAGGDANLSLRPGTGTQLCYTHYAYNPDQSSSLLVQLFLATLDQPLEPQLLTQQPEVALTPGGSDGEALEPAWSPDGQWLAYVLRANGSTSLAIMQVSDPARGAPDFQDYDTSTALSLGNVGSISYPVWSPDGKSLIFLGFKNNEYNLWLAQVTINGTTISLQGSPVQLTQGGVDGTSRPSWTSA